MGYIDRLLAKHDCLSCGGKGRTDNGYYTCLACKGLGYDYGHAPSGPEGHPDNLKLKADFEGAQFTCLCGSEDYLYTDHQTSYDDELKCGECGRVYTVEKETHIEIRVSLAGQLVAEGTY